MRQSPPANGLGWVAPSDTTNTGDGRYLGFAYSQYDFSTWLNTGAQVITGPSRVGQSAPFKNFFFDVVNNVIALLPGNPTDSSTFATSPQINNNNDVYAQS